MAEAFNPDKFLAETAPAQAPVAQGLRTPPAQGFNPDQFLAETAPAAQSFDQKSIADKFASLKNPTPEDKADALKGAGQILDWPGGLVRTGLASVGGLLSGKGEVVKPEDLENAKHGQAPPSSEYLTRMGVPEGPKVPEGIPLIGGTSARDVGGFAADVATDPLTFLAKGEKALRPLGNAAEAGGEKMYKSGFKKIDERLVEKGKPKLSDLLLKEGAPTGTTKQIAEKTEQMAKDLMEERQKIYQQASEKGVTIDLDYPAKRAEKVIAKMKSDPGLRASAAQLEELMNTYRKEGKVPIDKLSEWKSNLYNSLPQSAFDPMGQLKGPAKEFAKALAEDFREAIIEAGNKAEKGLGDKIDLINEKWGTLKSAERPTAMQIRRGETPNMLTSVDAILSGHPGLLAAKKAADASKTTYVRTKVGKGLMDIGKTGLLDSAARQGLITKKKGLVQAPQGELLQSKDDQ